MLRRPTRAQCADCERRFIQNNRITQLPAKESRKLALLPYCAQKIPQGQVFDEVQINELLCTVIDDYATMRRYLVDYGYLLRDAYGREYTRSTAPLYQED